MSVLSEVAASLRTMAGGFLERLPYLALAVIVFVAVALAGMGVRAGVRAIAQRNRRHYNLGLVLGRLAQSLIVFLGLLIALVIAIPGFTAGELVSILGLSGVAIGFAFRDIIQNFLAGILLLLAEPFRIGDQIVLDSFEGTVEEIQIRATLIRTYDGRRVVVPNSRLFVNTVTVNTAYAARRLEYDVGIGYGDDIERARRVVLDTLRAVPDVLRDPAPDALVVDLADSSIKIRVRWWVKPPRQMDALSSQDRVLTDVSRALVAAGFDLPFPTQQVLFHDQTEESDGDRSRQREGWPRGPGAAPRPARIVDALRGLKSADGPSTGPRRE